MKIRYVLAILVVCFLPLSAFAASLSVIPILDRPTGGGIVDGATYGMVGKPGHSYVCGLVIGGTSSSLSTSIMSPSGQTITALHAASESEASRYLRTFVGSDPSDPALLDNLIFFVSPDGTDEYGKYTVTVGISSGSPAYFFTSCQDTSTYCDYNTFLGQTNFLEQTGAASKAIRANLRLVNSDGTIVSGGTLTFPANLRRDIDIHSIAGPNSYGTLILQAINYIPAQDYLARPKLSTYSGGQLKSSVGCSFFASGID